MTGNAEQIASLGAVSSELAQDNQGLRLVRIAKFESPYSLEPGAFEAYARRFTTLFLDDARTFSGGNGKVRYGVNAWGEAFALKTLTTTDASEQRKLRHEYELQRKLSGLKGFPRVFGWGELEGNPTIIMEWIEGVSLSHAAKMLAVDGTGRLSPLTAARIGRDLFDVLSRMDALEGEFAHRDVTPANVMVRTTRMSVIEQAEEGVFDLCLCDFGSAAYVGESSEEIFQGGVVPAYAAPELLPGAPSLSNRSHTSPLIDVYSATSIVYELVCGRLPFQSYLDDKAAASDALTYDVKAKNPYDPPVMAHRAAESIESVLASEPEVAVVVSIAASDFSLSPDEGEVREALDMIDQQLCDLFDAGLQPKQADRPLASAMRDAFATFSFQYADNVGRALRGDPLVSCLSGTPASGFGGSPLRMRNILRSVGKAASAAVWLITVLATGILVNGADVSWNYGGAASQSALNGAMVSCMLALPGILGLVVRGKATHSAKGFLRGSIALAAGAALAIVAGCCIAPAEAGISQGLAAALFAAVASGWCPLVVDFALAAVPARRRKMLKAAAERHALESGNRDLAAKESEDVEGVKAIGDSVDATANDAKEEMTFEVLDEALETPDQRKDDDHDGK